jgi:sugar lactone lactonase YvrE
MNRAKPTVLVGGLLVALLLAGPARSEDRPGYTPSLPPNPYPAPAAAPQPVAPRPPPPPSCSRRIVGTGAGGFADGLEAAAQFNAPSGLAVARDGRVYVADRNNHRIRLILGGRVSTFAGTGKAGYENGRAAAARFNSPTGIAVDAKGTVYVADQGNHRIRIIEDGKVSTLAGSGRQGHADGRSSKARFNNPVGVAVDAAGTVYVADKGNHRIRAIKNDRVTTLAGSGTSGFADGPAATAQFDSPTALALEGTATLLVADSGNHRIRRISGGTVSTLAGGPPGSADGAPGSARFISPRGLATDASGRLFVADFGNGKVRVITVGRVGTLACSAAGPPLEFKTPAGVAVDAAGTVYVTSRDGHRVTVIASPVTR